MRRFWVRYQHRCEVSYLRLAMRWLFHLAFWRQGEPKALRSYVSRRWLREKRWWRQESADLPKLLSTARMACSLNKAIITNYAGYLHRFSVTRTCVRNSGRTRAPQSTRMSGLKLAADTRH